MVKGIDLFRVFFSDHTDQYVLIGGAACDVWFSDYEIDFRATRDLDLVLIVEAQTKEFGQRFWDFIKQGKYKNRIKSNGKSQFYRFDKPEEPGFPSMIELFSRSNWELEQNTILTPVHIDDSVSSLSAILLNDAYYELLLENRVIINGISVLKPACIIPFKAKAWLDLNEKTQKGEHVDSRDIKKHRNDAIRITSELMLDSCELSEIVKKDMREFVSKLHVSDEELKNLKLPGIHEADIIGRIKETYQLY